MAQTLTLSCMDIGRAVEACEAAAARYTESSGHAVRVVAADAFGQRSLEAYTSLFDVESARLDVLQFPASWAHVLANDLSTLDDASLSQTIPQLQEAGVVDQRRVGLPQHLAVTLLFLRQELFNGPPEVWQELRNGLASADPNGTSGMTFGATGGALFPFIMDWIYSFGGTGLTDAAVVRRALDALDASLNMFTSRTMASASAADAVTDFVSGRSAALMASSTALPAVADETGLDGIQTVIRPHESSVEGASLLATVWLTGVSRFSANPGPARDLADFLVSEAEQKQAAEAFGLAPTDASLYADPALIASVPLFGEIAERLDQLTLGPLATFGIAYLDLADAVSAAVRAFIEGRATVDETLTAITGAVIRARRQMN